MGVMLNKAAAEFDVPVNVTGVLDEDPAALLEVEMRTSLESGPTCLGMNCAWKENCPPAARGKGRVGKLPLTSTKLGLPEMVKAVTVVATFAVQVTESGSEVPLMEVLGKAIGPVQLRGRLTGEPNAYTAPAEPTKAVFSPKTGCANFPGLWKLKALINFSGLPSLGGVES